MNRREFLQRAGCGFGMVAMQSMLAAESQSLRVPHHTPRAKRVIFLFMQGGPSHMDMFEYKPDLEKRAGQPLSFKLPANYEAPGIRDSRLFGPISKFVRRGQRGFLMTDMLPHLGTVADELCFLHGMHADSEAHAPAIRQLHTGHSIQVRPSMGAWVLYGLGTENQNLPGFVTVCPVLGGDGGTPQLFGSAFLPAVYQGTPIGKSGDAKNARIDYLRDAGITTGEQRRQLDFLADVNRRHMAQGGADAELEGRAASFELAFRMQMEAPAVLDLSRETEATRALYGIGQKETDDFGRQCLMARRMAEAGVRFVQISDGGWDHHGKLRQSLPVRCKAVDKPIAGLITDLKQRGLLKDTLVLWGGEFGRTPFDQDLSQGKAPVTDRGREHNPRGFTMWMAGGGVRPGISHGQTDEFGWEAVEGKVHIHDLHATMLHLLGIDHERLTYRYTGRDFRLTDVFGRVVKEIL
ncbi:MAG: DUF1501 domain-containing protein [Bryobacteraceae bacterium]|nr:DUF1501 domain-containing protein [Bryobacteraceae bacterium]